VRDAPRDGHGLLHARSETARVASRRVKACLPCGHATAPLFPCVVASSVPVVSTPGRATNSGPPPVRPFRPPFLPPPEPTRTAGGSHLRSKEEQNVRQARTIFFFFFVVFFFGVGSNPYLSMAAKASATVMVLAAALAVLLLASSSAPVASAARADPAAVVPDGRHQVRGVRVLASF
jgi:hypothetical protein